MIDIVLSRRTESGDHYLKRFKCNDIQEFEYLIKNEVDIEYTSEWEYIFIDDNKEQQLDQSFHISEILDEYTL